MLTYKQRRKIKKSRKTAYLLVNLIYVLGKSFVYAICSIRKAIQHYYNAKEIGFDYYKIHQLIQRFSPRQFEVFCAELLKGKYNKVVLTPPSNDYGRDIICYDSEGNKIFVECKHYNNNGFVGREICQKLLGSMVMMNANKGIIITTGKYHRNAFEVTDKVANLELWNEDDIREIVLNMDKNQINRIIMKIMNKVC